jgi:L-ascorbate metabolism protein UlaG (beta-lactamase superfamily)
MRNLNEITIRWLGVAGIELGCPGRRIVFDPYFTRIRMRDMFLARVQANPVLVHQYINPCEAIFITHSHFDHLLDTAEAARETGAVVHGSPNTCRILCAEGLASNQIIEIRPGTVLEMGEVKISALAQRPHPFVFGFGMRPLKEEPSAPLRAREYAMDFGLSFLAEAGGIRLLTDDCLHPEEAGQVDILFINPHHKSKKQERHIRLMMEIYRPRVVIPIHWDDMWSPLSAPLRGQLAPTGRVFPPLARFNPLDFKRLVESQPVNPAVFIPERLREYTLGEVLNRK